MWSDYKTYRIIYRHLFENLEIDKLFFLNIDSKQTDPRYYATMYSKVKKEYNNSVNNLHNIRNEDRMFVFEYHLSGLIVLFAPLMEQKGHT